MPKLLSLLSNFLLVALILVGAMLTMYSLKLTGCYDKSNAVSNEISSEIYSKGLDKDKVCLREAENLITLDSCITEADKNTFLPASLRNLVVSFLPQVRPQSQSIITRISTHNEECSAYTSTLLNR